MYVRHISDPFSANRRGGPGVVVHKHSQAKAFSIFRSYDIRSGRAQKSGQAGRHLDTSQSILLATKNVQEQYTSTKTIGRLKTHGLLEDNPTPSPVQSQRSDGSADGSSQQGSSTNSVRRSRSQSLARKDKGGRDKGKAKSSQKEDKKKRKEKKDVTGSRTSSRDGATAKGDGFWSRLPGRHTATHSSLPSLSSLPVASSSSAVVTVHTSTPFTSYSSATTPTSTANSSPIIPDNPIPASTPPFRPQSRSRIPSSSHSYHNSRSEIESWEDEDDEVDSFDGHHAPVQKRSYAETYASIPPIHHEQARNLMRSGHSSIASTSRPMFTKIFPRKGGHPSDWLPNSPTTNLAPSPVPWMLTKNPNSQGGQVVMTSLNDNFGRVGLVPPRPTPQRSTHRMKDANSESLLLPVPDDSVYMLLPLFAGETDYEFQPEDMAQYEVPLESRKYLLVYYMPFEKRTGGGGKKVEQPSLSRSASQRTKDKTVFLSSFRVSAHLMSYQDFKGSGIRLPAAGLSVTGPLTHAQPPKVTPESHRDPVAIAQCSKRDNGIEFLPEGLHKLGLCDAEQVEQVVDPEDFDDDDEKVELKYELNALGRAVVEMAWVGAMAVTSFGTT